MWTQSCNSLRKLKVVKPWYFVGTDDVTLTFLNLGFIHYRGHSWRKIEFKSPREEFRLTGTNIQDMLSGKSIFFLKKRKDWEEWEYIKFLAWKYKTVDAIIMQTCIVSEEETGNSQRKLTFTYASVSWKNSWFAT